MALAPKTAEGPLTNGFEDVFLLPDSVPELALMEIDLSTEFLGKKLQYPLLINALTGGTEEALRINRDLGTLAARNGLAMAVGSMTIAFEDRAALESFAIVRHVNPDGIVLANCGADIKPRLACEAIEMIGADGLQLHFNIPQELAMPEGDRDFRGILDNLMNIVALSPVPVIAKEVGFGMTAETVQRLYGAGIRIFDNGGSGGTNFIAIEDKRGGKFQHQLDKWGISTAISLAEIISLGLPVKVVASGGMRSSLDIAKALAMGADLVGIAGYFLNILLENSVEQLEKSVESLLYQLRSVFLMSGARDCRAMRTKPVVLCGRTAEWLRSRRIDPGLWSRR